MDSTGVWGDEGKVGGAERGRMAQKWHRVRLGRQAGRQEGREAGRQGESEAEGEKERGWKGGREREARKNGGRAFRETVRQGER